MFAAKIEEVRRPILSSANLKTLIFINCIERKVASSYWWVASSHPVALGKKKTVAEQHI